MSQEYRKNNLLKRNDLEVIYLLKQSNQNLLPVNTNLQNILNSDIQILYFQYNSPHFIRPSLLQQNSGLSSGEQNLVVFYQVNAFEIWPYKRGTTEQTLC